MTSRPSSRTPQIIVADDAEALARLAAERLLARVSRADGRAAVCLTGGASPEGLYRLLAREPYRGRVPWDRVHWFMGDDRFVPEHDPLSNMGMARRLFLDHVPAPAENVHPIATDAGNPDEAARRYESELKRFYARDRLDPAQPLFDLVLMGLGDDGHTASLFPNAPALDEVERWAVGVATAGMAPFVPRVTLTFPTLASTREMLFLVGGAKKHDILVRVLSGEGSSGEGLPAARARSDGELVWLLDRATGIESIRQARASG
jgi:6-phosphogluconolactonase